MCFAACGVQKPLTDAQYEQSVRKDIPFAVSEFRQVKPDVYAFKCDKYVELLPDYDVSAATENLLLAAHAMGLGAVWTGLHPDMDRAKMVQEMLGRLSISFRYAWCLLACRQNNRKSKTNINRRIFTITAGNNARQF